MKRKTILVLLLADIAVVLLTMFKLWTLGETRVNSYIFAALIVFVAFPVSLCITFFVYYIIYSIGEFIKRLRDR